jgi:hypothetical protein
VDTVLDVEIINQCTTHDGLVVFLYKSFTLIIMKKGRILFVLIIVLYGCRDASSPQVFNPNILEEVQPRHLILSDIHKEDYSNKVNSRLSIPESDISISYIVPETNKESLFGVVRFSDSIGDDILVTDAVSLYRFDQSGRFVWKVHNQGRGPGEYLDISSVAVDSWREEIVVICGEMGNVFICDFEGRYKEKLELPFKPGRISVIDSARYLFFSASPSATTWAWLAYRDGTVLKTFHISESQSKRYDDGRRAAFFPTKHIGSFMGGYYMWHSDTVWFLDRNFEPQKVIFVIDSKMRGGGNVVFNPVYQMNVNVSGIKDRHYMYDLWCRSDGLIGITFFYDQKSLLYDIRSGSFSEYPKVLLDDIDYGPDVIGLPIAGIPHINPLQPLDIQNLDEKKIRKESALYKIYKIIHPDDNPVIRIINRK